MARLLEPQRRMMDGLMKLFKYLNRSRIAAVRQTFERGRGWIYYGKDALILAMGMKMLFNVSNWQIALIIPPLCVGIFTIGYIDKKWGIWTAESQFGAIEVTKFSKKLFKKP